MHEPTDIQDLTDGNNPLPIYNANNDVLRDLLPTSAQKATLLPATPIQDLTDAGTILADTRLARVTPTGDTTVTLPAAADFPACVDLVIKNLAAHVLTVTAAGTDLLDGAASADLPVLNASFTLWSDGVAWIIKAAPGT
jgi:hypothetical protein